jgi:hypothetical protein
MPLPPAFRFSLASRKALSQVIVLAFGFSLSASRSMKGWWLMPIRQRPVLRLVAIGEDLSGFRECFFWVPDLSLARTCGE